MEIGKKQEDVRIFNTRNFFIDKSHIQMNELKTEIIINAGIRIAQQNLANAYVLKKGDIDAGSIFVKVDTLDGYSKLFSRNLSYDFMHDKTFIQFQDLYPNQKIETINVDNRISKEISIDRDCWVIEIEDKNGINPFQNLNC